MYDLTDYSTFLDAEREEMIREALEAERAREADDAVLEDIVLEYEVKNMLEMM